MYLGAITITKEQNGSIPKIKGWAKGRTKDQSLGKGINEE